jgi:hypothetical protein
VGWVASLGWHSSGKVGDGAGRGGELGPAHVLSEKLGAGEGRRARDRRWALYGEIGAGAGRGAAISGSGRQRGGRKSRRQW